MKHLIVIADPHGGKNIALKRALEFQQKSKAKITFVGFCYANVGKAEDLALAKLSRSELQNTVVQNRTTQLREVLKSLKASSRKVAVEVLWGKDVGKSILAYCKQHPADLLIKSGTRQSSWLYTPTDWLLLRECSIPVLITATRSWKKKARVLAAVDFSTQVKSKQQLNDKIVQQARILADLLGDQLHLGFAITVPQALADMDLINPRKYAADKRKKVQPLVDAFCDRHQIDPANVHLRQGVAEKIIPSIANSLKADLVVCGTVGRKGVKGKLIGNTAENILSNLYTDILAVKP